jgi:hypothetical protein
MIDREQSHEREFSRLFPPGDYEEGKRLAEGIKLSDTRMLGESENIEMH